jgi:hypothetical protein
MSSRGAAAPAAAAGATAAADGPITLSGVKLARAFWIKEQCVDFVASRGNTLAARQ